MSLLSGNGLARVQGVVEKLLEGGFVAELAMLTDDGAVLRVDQVG